MILKLSDFVNIKVNWDDKYTLDKGLDLTLKWLKTNVDTLKNLPWEYIHKT